MERKVNLTDLEPSIVLTFCVFGTFIWRLLGVAIANHIDIKSELFKWFNCVAYAMLAGLIARIILIPSGTLATTPMFDRVAALIIGFIVFLLLKRNIFWATMVAFFVFLGLTALQ